jgi:hypothetical protein
VWLSFQLGAMYCHLWLVYAICLRWPDILACHMCHMCHIYQGLFNGHFPFMLQGNYLVYFSMLGPKCKKVTTVFMDVQVSQCKQQPYYWFKTTTMLAIYKKNLIYA